MKKLFDLNLVLVLKIIWYLRYGSSHVCKAVLMEVEDCEEIDILPAVFCILLYMSQN